MAYVGNVAALAAKKKSGLVRLYQLWAGQCSPRAASALARANCETLDDALHGMAAPVFMALPNAGHKTVAEIGAACCRMAGPVRQSSRGSASSGLSGARPAHQQQRLRAREL